VQSLVIEVGRSFFLREREPSAPSSAGAIISEQDLLAKKLDSANKDFLADGTPLFVCRLGSAVWMDPTTTAPHHSR
jgi:hypothetical protein